MLRKEEGRKKELPVRLSSEEAHKRRPLPPEALVEALQDPIPVETRKPRAVRVSYVRANPSEPRIEAAETTDSSQAMTLAVASETVLQSRTEGDT